MKSHAGIPHGSTCNLGADLEIYLQNNVSQGSSQWNDQSSAGRHAVQETSANRPSFVAGGGLLFQVEEGGEDMMDFSSFTVASNENFLIFIVWNPTATSTNAYLSDGTSEVFQITSGNVALFKSPAQSNAMNHSSTFTITDGEKSVFMIERVSGATGQTYLYKNGLKHDPSVRDASTFDLQNLGSKNDASNWFEGTMHDVGVISGDSVTDRNRDMIIDHLCSKHGIERLG